ncbi:MAG: DUF4911 domain-containing protein [Synergistes sp.]|nr:DUF4911 domain-containing protein [Synergistes sp.]MCR5335298.1 DUF4911 domain-containing protein [Synergistes sp.]
MRPEIEALHFTVPQKDIYYISWIIDAAEGIGFLQTDDPKSGSITIFSPEEQKKHIYALVSALRAEGIDIAENKRTDERETE